MTCRNVVAILDSSNLLFLSVRYLVLNGARCEILSVLFQFMQMEAVITPKTHGRTLRKQIFCVAFQIHTGEHIVNK
jgi:hypothetical protein